jgi:hypothetical protein
MMCYNYTGFYNMMRRNNMNVIKGTIYDIKEAVDFAFPYQGKITTRCRPLFINCKKEELKAIFESYV